jgi:hypothetical protein
MVPGASYSVGCDPGFIAPVAAWLIFKKTAPLEHGMVAAQPWSRRDTA